MQQETYTGGYSSGYSSGYSGYQSSGGGFKKFNGLELIVIVLCLIAIIAVGVWGFLSANRRFRDEQRTQHIDQVLAALDQFYNNSSLEPSRRRYPISVCSNSLNEVDYELTLREHLTGQRPALDRHAYIDTGDFPRDPWGDYVTDFRNKQVPFRCPSIFVNGPATTSYEDSFPSCDFSSTRGLRQCYLFTSSVNGDSFQLGYWSEVNNAFIVYSRFRSDPLEANAVRF